MAVDNAVKDLLNRDTMYRNELRKQVEEKLNKAEINRKKQEISRAMSLTESKRWVTVQLTTVTFYSYTFDQVGDYSTSVES